MNVEQYDQAGLKSISVEKGFCVIRQDGRTVRLGALLDWDELIELKQSIEQMCKMGEGNAA